MSGFRRTCMATVAVLGISGAIPGTTTKALADEPFLGDIMTFGGNFCPRGWQEADGRLLAINSNAALFSLLGTTYGGDGRTTFALPDLRGRSAIGDGTGPGLTTTTLGQKRGGEQVVLTEANLPRHRHFVNANNRDGDKAGPANKLLGASPPGGTGNETIYNTEPPNVLMNPDMIEDAGRTNPDGIAIRDPYLVMLRCIATLGLFPSRS